MKTISEPAVINFSIIILAIIAAIVVYFSVRGTSFSLLSNIKVNLAILVVLGMMICTQGGIGRVAVTGQWTHPLAIIGYILGASILTLAACVFFNIKLPFIVSNQQATLIVAILIGLKFINAFAHTLLNRVQ